MNKMISKFPRLSFGHIVSGFPSELEKLYYDDFFNSSLPIVRIAMILGIILYSAFGILDIWIVPIHKSIIWTIRFAIVVPVSIVTMGLTFTSLFKKQMQKILSITGFIYGAGIVTMIAFVSESELGFKFYYAGLMLVIMWIYALLRLRFVYATTISWMITVSYEINSVFINRMLTSLDNVMVFINNNFFFISANIIGMIASFTIEWYMRKNYLLRLEIERSFNLNQKYLDNIKEGLLLIDERNTIMNQYSEYLTGMVERQDIEGTDFVDLIYPDPIIQDDERKELRKFLSFLFHNVSADFDMIMDINPFHGREIEIRVNEFVTKKIVLNADFIRIYEQERVEYIMVIFEDVTEKRNYEQQLEAQKTRYSNEIESISSILKSGPSLFVNFIFESNQTLNELRARIGDFGDRKLLDSLFRKTHSLKGSARHLNLNHISAISHELEHLLESIRKSPDENVSRVMMSAVTDRIDELFGEFQNLGQLIDRIKTFSALELSGRDAGGKGPLEDFIKSLKPMVESISSELDRLVRFEAFNELEDFPHLPEMSSPIIHLIRNSIDHGIEDQFERLSKHKDASGTVICRLKMENSFFIIEVEDDGRGVDYAKIRERGISSGLIDESITVNDKARLMRLIFTPGFSSRSEVTEISGRGYGLDIVKDAADRLGGKISVQSRKDIGTKITVSIPA